MRPSRGLPASGTTLRRASSWWRKTLRSGDSAVADVLVRTVTLACSAEHAFETFTRKIDLWWPRGHRRSPEAALRLDAAPGGRLVERAPDGAEWAMGRITDFDPPSRLSLDWFPGSPVAPTSVDIQFTAIGSSTKV